MTDNNENARAGRPGGDTSRRRFLQGTTGAFGIALASPGLYKMIDTIAKPPDRPAVAGIQPSRNNISCRASRRSMSIPLAWRAARARSRSWCRPCTIDVITATLNVPPNAKALREAQQHLESVILGVERQFPPTPAGMGIAVAWGLPYFSQYIPRLGKASEFFKAGTPYPRYLPIDVSTSKTEGHTVYAVQEARTFPSDQPPPGFGPVRLEQNHVAVLLRSDSLANMTAATQALFGPGSNQAGSLFNVTSIRRGFAGGGFYGGQQSLPSKMALAAHIPGAQSIPRHAQAFLGFDTTLVSNMGPDVIANLETLPGLTDQWPNGYFKQGTTMHLSHLFEDLATWYEQSFPQYGQRANAMLYPGQSPTPAPGTLALQPPGQTEAQVAQGVQKYHSYGHTGSLSVVDSTASQITSHYGEVYPAGTTIPVRGDFNTLDNPFYYTSDPAGRPLQPTSQRPGCTSLYSSRRLQSSISSGSRWTATSPVRHSLSTRAPPTPASTRS